jgi:group I intron endonuclease
MVRSGIYRIRNSVNGKSYIGSAQDFRTRWNIHRCLLRAGKHHSPHLQAAWKAYGEQQFAFEIVEIVTDHSCLVAREQFWLDELKTADRTRGYNARPTAENQLGLRHSEESKRRISIAQMGKTPWNKGIPIREDAKQKMIAKKLGRKQSPELVEKRMQKLRGLKRSDEFRARMSAIAKAQGRKPPGRKAISVNSISEI